MKWTDIMFFILELVAGLGIVIISMKAMALLSPGHGNYDVLDWYHFLTAPVIATIGLNWIFKSLEYLKPKESEDDNKRQRE